MTKRLRWGVLSTAQIGIKTVIPAMKKASNVELYALAGRDEKKTREAADKLDIPVSFGSYEALLQDPLVEAVYIPLPNHLHVPWILKSLEAGKPVLCEKPLALTAREVESLMAVRDRTGLAVGEAFMVKLHPQWIRAEEMVKTGVLGQIRAIQGVFSYFNENPANIRNCKEYGGGGIYDIGCYPIMTSRMVLGEEPRRVLALTEEDSRFGVDRLASAILDFPSCQGSFISATQMVAYQKMQIFGTEKRLDIERPFNPLPDREARICVDTGASDGTGVIEELLKPCNQYTLQAEAFTRAVLGQGPVPVPLENSLAMARIYEALFRSARSGGWVEVEQ
jgi:predicted dehydrogenase